LCGLLDFFLETSNRFLDICRIKYLGGISHNTSKLGYRSAAETSIGLAGALSKLPTVSRFSHIYYTSADKLCILFLGENISWLLSLLIV